ncbi:hypothetical protein [Taibaiella soli]|uniref:Uncharacterized protein n=1 Tax=Taibaiella soli TaxID=1649169 RepID=A0A2W2A6R2_9BACT|nr:hypothetical protein [Taibaiella soli]PZF70975.1 hypothetical protein DN068_19915 [Taibaiella soli]
MNNESVPREILFSAGAIESQLQKIYRHPVLEESPILKKFLSFIVHETLEGRSVYLKEYTIAVNVLDRPASFNPQQSCVVRIHARRLRDALQQYYMDSGSRGDIIISIPKGKYVPRFDAPISANQSYVTSKKVAPLTLDKNIFKPTIAVCPFSCMPDNLYAQQFGDNLCLELSASLLHFTSLSVIAYQATRHISGNHLDIKEFNSVMNCRYLISGGIQTVGEMMRLNVQLIECGNYNQSWAEIYECKISNANIFELQDTICRHIIEGVGPFIGH